jgi:hypothetical protein
MEQMIVLHVGVPTRPTDAAAPAFLARGKGTIVIASRRYQSRNLERRTEGKSLRPGSLTIAASRTRQQGFEYAGRVVGCNVERILEHSRHAGLQSSTANSDAGRRNGRCRTCRARPWRRNYSLATQHRPAFKPDNTHVLIETPDQVFAEYIAHTTATATSRLIHHLFAARLVAERSKIKLLRELLKSSPQLWRLIPTASMLFKVSRPRFIRPAPNVEAEGS